MNTKNTTVWFVFGLVLLALLASVSPKYAGGVAILLALVLALEATRLGLLGTKVISR